MNNEKLNIKKGTFKYKMFLLFNTLNELKKSTSEIFLIILLVVESLQISYLSFENQFSHLWDKRLKPMISILKYLFYGLVGYYDDFDFFKIYFFIILVIFISGILTLCYLYYKISNNKVEVRSFFIFSLYASAFNQVLIVPFMVLLLSIVDCKNNTTQILNVNCFTTETYFYYTCALVFLLLIIIFGLVLCLFNSDFTPTDCQAKISSSYYSILNLLKKVLLVILFSLETPFSQYNLWILGVVQLILTSWDFIYLITEQPFFNDKCFRLIRILRSLELFYAVIVFVCLFLGDNYHGHLYLMIIGITMIILVNVIVEKNKFSKFMRFTNKLIPEEEVKKLLFFVGLFENSTEVENYSLGRAVILLQENNTELLNHSSKLVLEQLTSVIEEVNSISVGKSS
jgi:hypothetical protein